MVVKIHTAAGEKSTPCCTWKAVRTTTTAATACCWTAATAPVSASRHQQVGICTTAPKCRAPSGRRAARRDNEADRRQALCAVPSGVCAEGEESALLSGLRRQAETAEGSRTAAPKAGIGVTLFKVRTP